MTRIVLAEDEHIFSEAMIALLADVQNIEIVQCFENGKLLLDYLATEPTIDLVLMDIRMPVLNGIDATKFIKKHFPSIKVLILSFNIKAIDVATAMGAGADGYLSKSTSKLEIIDAIKCLKNNKPYYSKDVLEVLATVNSLNGGKGIIKLSNREQEVLLLLSKGFTTIHIGVQLSLAESTIKTYRKNLLQKFEALNSADLTRIGIESGYI